MAIFDNLIESITQWFDGLSEREKKLLAMLLLSLLALLFVGTIYGAISRLNSKESQLIKNKEQVAKIQSLRPSYLSSRSKSEREKLRIARNNISLFSFIQSITTSLGLSVRDLNEQKRPLPRSNIVEISVKLNLIKLSIDKLTALIDEIETSNYGDLVKVTKLKVNKRFDEPDLLDLQMTISTWKSV